jgi:hypothetical protein
MIVRMGMMVVASACWSAVRATKVAPARFPTPRVASDHLH